MDHRSRIVGSFFLVAVLGGVIRVIVLLPAEITRWDGCFREVLQIIGRTGWHGAFVLSRCCRVLEGSSPR